MFLSNSYSPTLSHVEILESKCPTSTKLASGFIALIWKSPSTNCSIGWNDKEFLPKYHEMWPISVPVIDAPQNCHASSNDLVHIHASKFLQTQATRLFVHHFQPSSILNLWTICPLYELSSSLGYYFELISLMCWKHVNKEKSPSRYPQLFAHT